MSNVMSTPTVDAATPTMQSAELTRVCDEVSKVKKIILEHELVIKQTLRRLPTPVAISLMQDVERAMTSVMKAENVLWRTKTVLEKYPALQTQ